MLEGIGGVATALAVLIAVVFGLAQMRQFGRQCRDAVAMQILGSMLTPEYAVLQLCFAFEEVGAMAFGLFVRSPNPGGTRRSAALGQEVVSRA